MTQPTYFHRSAVLLLAVLLLALVGVARLEAASAFEVGGTSGGTGFLTEGAGTGSFLIPQLSGAPGFSAAYVPDSMPVGADGVGQIIYTVTNPYAEPVNDLTFTHLLPEGVTPTGVASKCGLEGTYVSSSPPYIVSLRDGAVAATSHCTVAVSIVADTSKPFIFANTTSALGSQTGTTDPARPALVIAPVRPPAADTLASNKPTPATFVPALTYDGLLAPGALGVPGEHIAWVLTLRNTGDGPGTDLVISTTLRNEVRIDAVETGRGSFAVSDQLVVFTIPYLNPGESVEMRVETTVVRSPADGRLVSEAVMSPDGSSGAAGASALAEVSVPASLPATGYPLDDKDLPGEGEPSIFVMALVAVALVSITAVYVWRRGQ